MKTLKSILLILLTLSLSAALHAQQVSQAFPGTWQADNGNQRFIVKIWQEGTEYLGHYKMVQLNNGIPGNIISNSRQIYSNGAMLPYSIYTGLVNNMKLSGFIHDNTIINKDEDFKTGDLLITLNQMPGCFTCAPFTATWKVSQREGIIVGANPPFSVPINIVLTKVSDTVVWD